MGKPISRSYYDHFEFISQFEGAERIAVKYGITRDDTDQFGLESQLKARRAINEGRFDEQIVELTAAVFDEDGQLTGENMAVTRDEVPRDTSREALARLKPVARADGIHTAGTSSQISDGASAVLVMSAEEAERRSIAPLVRLTQSVLVGCDPILMLEGPIPATEKMLHDNSLSIEDIDVFEVNEAFASIVLAWEKACGPGREKINPNGGAIALGHPLGATGCFLTTKAVHELHRSGGRYGLVSMCCGGGLIERV
jgi:acetyl-CoA C-acetyltransferase